MAPGAEHIAYLWRLVQPAAFEIRAFDANILARERVRESNGNPTRIATISQA